MRRGEGLGLATYPGFCVISVICVIALEKHDRFASLAETICVIGPVVCVITM